MKTILLCFANDEKESLQTLKFERSEILKLLDKGNNKNHFTLKDIPNATRTKIRDGLIDYRESLNVFLFSGHAGRDKLLFEDGIANAEGIAGLLGKCPNLELVILNGCSTVGQVEELINLPNHPVVIATSAPVEERSATNFSITFFKTLVEKKATLKDAFETAIDAVKILHADNNIKVYKDLVARGKGQGIWGLYEVNKKSNSEKWKMPKKKRKELDKFLPKNKISGDANIVISGSNSRFGNVSSNVSKRE